MSVVYKLQYGSQEIDFTLVRRERRTMQISVLPDTSVEVVAPLKTAELDILKRMRKRAGWIRRQMRYFQQYLPRTPERQFVAGETHLYLGRRYRLKVIRSLCPAIKLKRGYIEVPTNFPSRRDALREEIEQWQRVKASEWFRNRLTECLRRFPQTGDHRPDAIPHFSGNGCTMILDGACKSKWLWDAVRLRTAQGPADPYRSLVFCPAVAMSLSRSWILLVNRAER